MYSTGNVSKPKNIYIEQENNLNRENDGLEHGLVENSTKFKN